MYDDMFHPVLSLAISQTVRIQVVTVVPIVVVMVVVVVVVVVAPFSLPMPLILTYFVGTTCTGSDFE